MVYEILPPRFDWFGRVCPVECSLVGYAYLIERFALPVPVPLRLFGIGTKQRARQDWDQNDYTGWTVLEPRYWPKHGLRGQLTFALKYEGVDLAVLKRLCADVPQAPEVINAWVQEQPNSQYARRMLFWMEWFKTEVTNRDQSRPEPISALYALDPKLNIASKAPIGKLENISHISEYAQSGFSPLVRRTRKIDAYLARDWVAEAEAMTATHTPEMLERAAAFMLLNDSRASFKIEDEQPGTDRNQAWAKAIGQTMDGSNQDLLNRQKLIELQKIIMGDTRFVKLGVRDEEGFIGTHDAFTQPQPVWISARHKDLDSLLDELIQFARVGIYATHPIIAAAILAFGFNYIHPFADGNGRLHRYLIHYVLSKRGMHPAGMIFPISVAILRNLREYEAVLNSYSSRALPLIDWESTAQGNVHILNDTGDLYRYWDATPHVEFLFKCVEETIIIDLPNELKTLARFDSFKKAIDENVNLESRRISLLFQFLNQNGGKLSKNKRTKNFNDFTDDDVAYFENLYATSLDSDD